MGIAYGLLSPHLIGYRYRMRYIRIIGSLHEVLRQLPTPHKLECSLVVPMAYRGRITSLQFINANGEKKMMYGAKKSGSYYRIGNETDCILICEGWATGATLHEATQLCVYIAFDSGNLMNVAREVRKQFPLHKIIICADNDQYKKTNTGIKAAEKTACAIDADIIYPIFKDVSSKPTDFNDLYMLEGYSPIIDLINPLCNRSYNPKPKQCEQFCILNKA